MQIRPLLAAMLIALLDLVALRPAHAQASRKSECDTISLELNKRIQASEGAHEARRMYQVRRAPALTHAYLRELRSAVQQERLAFDFLAIAQHFSFEIDPDSAESIKISVQGRFLPRAEAVAKLVPENAVPISRDSALETQMGTRLDNAVMDEAIYQLQVTPRLQLLRCHELPQPVIAAAPQPAAPATAPQRTSALFNRSATAPAAPADPHRVCTAAAEQVVDLEKKQDEAYMLRWAIDDNYHDSFFAVASLRDAHKAGRLDDQFEVLARMFDLDTSGMTLRQKIVAQLALRKQVSDLMARARALTGRPRDKWIDPDAGGLEDMLLDDEDEEMPSVDAAVRAKERAIEDNFFRAQTEAQQAQKRLADLKCDDLPAPPPTDVGGPMKRRVTMLRQTVRGSRAGDPADLYEHAFSPDSARHIRQRPPYNDYVDDEQWNWQGMPDSLGPGQTFTITITGRHAANGPHARATTDETAFVRPFGLEIIGQQDARCENYRVTNGQYVLRVPMNAKRVIFELGEGLVSFVRYCYGDCPP